MLQSWASVFALTATLLGSFLGNAGAQEATPPDDDAPGAWGVGLNLGITGGGGASPAGQYNIGSRLVLEGSVNIYSSVTAIGGELFYRFLSSTPPPSTASVVFEPVAGGGLFNVIVDTPFGTESFAGVTGSGGAFMHLPKDAHWRFKGLLSFTQFDYEGAAFRGFGMSLGAFYFF